MYDYVWYLIAAAAGLGFALAWICQAIRAASKSRKINIERDVALAERDQVRGELKSLYATQRRSREQAEEAARANAAKIRGLDERMAGLSQELRHARGQAKAAKAREEELFQARAAEISALEARNAYLETRVGNLEHRIHKAERQPLPARPVEQGNRSRVTENSGKQAWQVSYLTQRVRALEEKLVRAKTVKVPAPVIQPDNSQEEQLERLRWRTRYLEGRLAHFEEAGVQPTAPVLPKEDTVADDEPVAEKAAAQDHGEDMHPAEALVRILEHLDRKEAERAAKARRP